MGQMFKIRFFAKFLLMIVLYLLVLLRKGKSIGQVRVLIFHEVLELDRFKKVISFLGRDWNFITPSQFIAFNEGRATLKGRNLLVTFDDGFISSCHAQNQVLQPKGIKSIFFLATSFIGIDSYDKCNLFIKEQFDVDQYGFEHARFPMSWREANLLSDSENLIASHTATHPRLSDISLTRLKRDIDLASSQLESEMQVFSQKDFAFPFGGISSIDRESFEFCSLRFERIYSGFRGNNTPNCKLIFRDSINLNEPLFYTKVYLSGILDMNRSKIFKILGCKEVAS
ncbi:hypothetical protein DN730_10440 [Marinomonas piezotolerans]|uniref:NodB homology domain-containing protein n=1 Tax=Marinomonas piezotolerans TaxID=2213058 RepID=A0A370U8C0_9GAMM|nr:polysaccharide deacetylase family protein [Marinomonas piezotolerans]RDL44046.1 hypothetical protein DN730_10440 [Marinomonas piezotolerans]